jgi:hypothetical protein
MTHSRFQRYCRRLCVLVSFSTVLLRSISLHASQGLSRVTRQNRTSTRMSQKLDPAFCLLFSSLDYGVRCLPMTHYAGSSRSNATRCFRGFSRQKIITTKNSTFWTEQQRCSFQVKKWVLTIFELSNTSRFFNLFMSEMQTNETETGRIDESHANE